MFYYFPGNYTWSSGFNLALMAGGELGELNRWLEPLREGEPDAAQWSKAWTNMAEQQQELAAADLKAGYDYSAGARYLRASVYHQSGERQIPPGPEKSAGYLTALECFQNAIKYMGLPLKRFEVESPDGILPGYLIPAENPVGTPPVVIFYCGFDVTKELLYCFIHESLAVRGISCVVMDSPGVGEPLRLRNVPSRPDYEVPTKAIIDYLETCTDVDASRVGIMGISLGGYYAPRSTAFEPRISACACWGAIWDWGATWEKRWATRSKTVSVPWFQLPWVMGTETMEEGLERVKQWTLVDVLPKITVPFLIVHGANDRQIPIEDAHKAFAAVSSKDKQMRVFTEDETGAEHCQTDGPGPARELIADWFKSRLVKA